jgi:hypothetical protein
VDKRAKYKAVSNKVLYEIIICIDETDEEYIKDFSGAKDVWEGLRAKYSKIRPQTIREDLKKLVNYKLDSGTSVEDAWTELRQIRRRIGIANPAKMKAITETELFEYLLGGLPDEYSTTRAALDAQINLDVHEKLLVLQNHQDQLRATAAVSVEGNALAAKDDSRSISLKRERSRHRSNERTCYLCGGKRHQVRDCELWEGLAAIARREIRRAKNQTTQKGSRKSSHKSHGTKAKGYDKGHVANSESEGSREDKDKGSESSSDDESSTDEEYAAISRDAIGKIPRSRWAADSGATSHMTDQPRLFRGPLISIPRRTIRVGGGKLYSNQMGIVEMRAESGSMLLDKVLFVPRLGVNLLSTRKICSQDHITGAFDDKNMWFTRHGKRIIKADISDGIYIVSWIAKGLQETAFLAKDSYTNLYTNLDQENSSDDASDTYTRKLHRPRKDIANTNDGKDKLSNNDLKRYTLMHRRFGHCGPEKLRRLHRVSNITKIRVPGHAMRSPCGVCKLAKLKKTIHKQLSPWKDRILELVSIDACGPLPKSLRGNTIFGQIVDNASRKEWSIAAKSRDELVMKLRHWKTRVENECGLKVGRVRVDNASEFVSLVKDWSQKEGLTHEASTVYQSNQNGLVERAIQTAEGDARAMLIDARLPIEFWDEAVEARTYLRNRLPGGVELCTDNYTLSPEQAYSGKMEVDVNHIRVFGSKCYSYVDPKSLPKGGRTDKLMPRGRVGVFMGYSDNTTKQFKVYAPDLGYTTRSASVVWDEGIVGGTIDLKVRGPNSQGTPCELPDRNPVGRPKQEETLQIVTPPSTEKLNNFSVVIPAKTQEIDQSESRVDLTRPPGEIKGCVQSPENQQPITPKANEKAPTDPTPQGQGLVERLVQKEEPKRKEPELAQTRPYDLRKRKASDSIDDRQAKIIRAMLALVQDKEMGGQEIALLAATGTIQGIRIPQSYDEAVNDPENAEQWKAAIQEEIASLKSNNTWEEERLPKSANTVSTKWVFTVKLTVNGEVERFKARLVARGFSQVWGEDFHETFAPTVRMDTLRIFLAIVAAENLECRQFDIKNAFTESKLRERVFLSAPQGVEVRKGHVLRVLRSLYGLKQAARDWNTLARQFLVEIGFQQSLAEPCLYTHNQKGIIVLLYVDDIPAAARQSKQLDWLYAKLSSRFNTKDLGGISKILGARVTRNRKSRELWIDQEQYLRITLDHLGYNEPPHKEKHIPANGYDKLLAAKQGETLTDEKEYQRAIGSVMYGMIYTRPDIAFTTGRLSQHLKGPVQRHYGGLKELLRYIGTTINQKIRYGPSTTRDLVVYTDADWAGDKTDRKSTSGFVVMLYGGPVCWASRKQTSVATSSTESEYIALSTGAKQAVWIGQVIRDMGFPDYIGSDPNNVSIKGDNQGSLALVKNPHLHERSKHIDIQYHYIRDLEEKGKIKVSYIPTTDMVADGLTKPLGRIAFNRFRELIGISVKITTK